MWQTRLRSLGGEDPLEEGVATHSSIPAWRIPWTEEPGGLQSMRAQRVRHDWSELARTHAKVRLSYSLDCCYGHFSLPQRFLLKGQLWTDKIFILRYLAVRYIAPESKFHQHQRNTKVHFFHPPQTVKCQVKETTMTYSPTHCVVSTLVSPLLCSVIPSLLEYRMLSFPTGFSDPNHLLSTQGNKKKKTTIQPQPLLPSCPHVLSGLEEWGLDIWEGHMSHGHRS